MYSIKIYGTGSKGNCAVISDGETQIMIDAGLLPTDILITNISAILISHEHL